MELRLGTYAGRGVRPGNRHDIAEMLSYSGAVPGRFFLTHTAAEIARPLGRDPVELEPLAQRLNIAPGEMVWALDATGFQQMRWGLLPVGRKNARGRPVVDTISNARGGPV